jgi:hypothetical protein
VPPLNLFDATASDLSDCFASRPDPARYKALPVDKRIFDPATAHESRSGRPGPRMDDPRYTPFPPGFPYRSTIKKR